MKMKYFTKKGTEQVTAKYQSLKSQKFYFSEAKNKEELVDILIEESICDYGFHITFLFKNNITIPIFDFMKLNSINYNFHDFETISVDI